VSAPRPPAANAPESIYEDGRYAESNPTWHVEDSAWKARRVAEIVGRNRLAPRTVGEIGCGAGEILAQLRELMPADVRFTGYDIADDAIRMAEARRGERLDFVRADLLASGGEPFDLLLCMDVFEHVEDYMGFLRAMRGKGVHKVFHIPLNLSVQAVMRSRPILLGREVLGHLHYFTRETALATLRDTGYEVVDWTYTAGGVERGGTTAFNRLARLPRRLAYRLHPDFAVRVLGGYSLLVLCR
jgi:2-polyprenyl-3-methyl-5-hydroxy-6-metoxy-1,4-benzoquinol methylase